MTECVVCYTLTDYDVSSNECNLRHPVCKECIEKIITIGNKKCPYCRALLLNEGKKIEIYTPLLSDETMEKIFQKI